MVAYQPPQFVVKAMGTLHTVVLSKNATFRAVKIEKTMSPLFV